MGIIKNGILGYFKGNISSVRGAKVNGVQIIKERKYNQTVIQREALKLYRDKLSTLSHGVQIFNQYMIPIYFKNNKIRESAYTRFISKNYGVVNDDLEIDYNKLIVSEGSYPIVKISNVSLLGFGNLFIIELNKDVNTSRGETTDIIDMILYIDGTNYIVYKPEVASVNDEVVFVNVPRFSDFDTMYIYAIRRSFNNKLKSISTVFKLSQ